MKILKRGSICPPRGNVIQGLARPQQINMVYDHIISQIAPNSKPTYPPKKQRSQKFFRAKQRSKPSPNRPVASSHPIPKPPTDLCQYCDFWDKVKGGCLIQRVHANSEGVVCPFTGIEITVNLPQTTSQRSPRRTFNSLQRMET